MTDKLFTNIYLHSCGVSRNCDNSKRTLTIIIYKMNDRKKVIQVILEGFLRLRLELGLGFQLAVKRLTAVTTVVM